MDVARTRRGCTPRSMLLALSTVLVCAGGSWTFDAGSVLAPEPADLKSSLAGTYGATAAAVIVEQQPSTLLLWPASWQVGPSIVVGTPCSPFPLGYGTKPNSRIEGSGSLRACLRFDTWTEPPANAVRPLPPMPVVSCTGGGESYTEVTSAVVEVVSWPAEWRSADGNPSVYPGQPCSDFPLLAGEATYKHIQTQSPFGSSEGPFRCVRNKAPLVYPGP